MIYIVFYLSLLYKPNIMKGEYKTEGMSRYFSSNTSHVFLIEHKLLFRHLK